MYVGSVFLFGTRWYWGLTFMIGYMVEKHIQKGLLFNGYTIYK